MPDSTVTNRNIGRATNVCVRCQRTWDSFIYPWWKDQPSFLACSECAAKRWSEEQGARAGRSRPLIRQGGKAH